MAARTTTADGLLPAPPGSRTRDAVSAIKRVWIEEGCIACSLCTSYCPEVFLVENGDTCEIKPDAPKWFLVKDEQIRDAALDCPVEVIKHD